MKKAIFSAILLSCLYTNASALEVSVADFKNGEPIPAIHAYCINKDGEKHAPGENISPSISWTKGPEGTKAYAIVVVDRDVPKKFDNANKEGKTIGITEPRQNFYHWMLLNIPADVTEIPEGKGKDKNVGLQLVSDYLKFSGEKPSYLSKMKYTGYDGMCPPWNDERIHNYHFKVLALSNFYQPQENDSGDKISRALTKLTLAEGEVVGTYTLNDNLKTKAEATAEEPKKEEKTEEKPKADDSKDKSKKD